MGLERGGDFDEFGEFFGGVAVCLLTVGVYLRSLGCGFDEFGLEVSLVIFWGVLVSSGVGLE